MFREPGLAVGVLAFVLGLAGVAIGCVYGLLFTRFGVPSLVITLARLLAVLGLHLKVLGTTGTISLGDVWLDRFTNRDFLPQPVSYALAVLVRTRDRIT